jgi:hypothetical protein
LNDLIRKILIKDQSERIDLDGVRNHPWVCFDGLEPPKSIPPKVTGIVGDSSLAKVISSINYEQDHVIYTFESIEARKKVIMGVKGEANDEVAVRKSIVIARKQSESGLPPNTNCSDATGHPISSNAKDSLEDFPRERGCITSRLPPLPKNPVEASTASKPAARRIRATTISVPRATVYTPQEIPLNASQDLKKSIAEIRASANFFKPIPIILLPQETPVDDKPTQGRRRSATISAKTGNLFRRLTTLPGTHVVSEEQDDRLESEMVGEDLRKSAVMRRMAMVSPDDSNNENSPGNVDIKVEEINTWHFIHHPPKSIRTLKFAFNSAASSSILDPAFMFQSLHNSLLALKEYQTGKLTFERNPDFYIFNCTCKSELFKDNLLFEIEICKVWLMSMHALKVKKQNGNAFLFKDIHDRIVKGLEWTK